MKKFLLCLSVLAFGGAAMAQSGGSSNSKAPKEKYNDFIPIGPAPIDFKVIEDMKFSELSRNEENNEMVINLLPNELVAKSVMVINKKGEMAFSAIELSVSGNTYVVKTDYIKYTTLPVRLNNENGEVVGVARVGVGIRVEATLRTKASKITVTDLHALGEMAQKRKLSGTIVTSIMGIESEEVTSGFTVNAEISPTSIAETLQGVEAVKNAIYDPDTHLTPQVLEIKYTKEYASTDKNVYDLSMPILLANRGEACVVIK